MNEDLVLNKLLEHDKRFERLDNKVDGTMTKEDGQRIMSTLEQVVVIVKKIQLQMA
ncbi:MAG: hypothetical protein Q7K39_02150 [Candidatus Magasanikbacteria bacterium]|nr:hypothetical protein [Candidatus Magasanikbacteria bacterium]